MRRPTLPDRRCPPRWPAGALEPGAGSRRRLLAGLGAAAVAAALPAAARGNAPPPDPAPIPGPPPSPRPQPPAPPPLRSLLFVGDSLANGVAALMAEVLRPTGREQRNARVEPHVFTGAGLIARPGRSVVEATEARLDRGEAFDAVIVLVGVNDVGMPLGAGGFYEADWQARYAARMAALADAVAAAGARLAWVEIPALNPQVFQEPVDRHLRPLQRRVAAARPGVLYVETLGLTAPDGVFSVTHTSPRGEERRLRADDGIHFTAYGYRLVARHILVRMQEAFGWVLLPGPDWRVLGE